MKRLLLVMLMAGLCGCGCRSTPSIPYNIVSTGQDCILFDVSQEMVFCTYGNEGGGCCWMIIGEGHEPKKLTWTGAHFIRNYYLSTHPDTIVIVTE